MRSLVQALLVFLAIVGLGLAALWFLVEPTGPPPGYERLKPIHHPGIGG